MIDQAKQIPPPGAPQIYQKSFMDAQQQIQQQTVAGQAKTPQSPASPAPVGSKGPPQTSSQAPSQNTPTAEVEGGQQ
jgi:hypothetical protein